MLCFRKLKWRYFDATLNIPLHNLCIVEEWASGKFSNNLELWWPTRKTFHFKFRDQKSSLLILTGEKSPPDCQAWEEVGERTERDGGRDRDDRCGGYNLKRTMLDCKLPLLQRKRESNSYIYIHIYTDTHRKYTGVEQIRAKWKPNNGDKSGSENFGTGMDRD